MRDNWKEANINEACDILDSFRIPLNSEQREKIPGGVPYYGANGVQGYISRHLFDEDLILMAEDGGNFEEYDRRPIAYKISGKSWVNNHAHILRAKDEFNQDYIFYSIVHKNIIPFIKGGTRSKLNLSDLKEIQIEYPSLPQQRKIAKILSTCDTVIAKTEEAIAKYQAIKQGMMHDLFTRGILQEDYNYKDKNGTWVELSRNQLRPKYQDAPELYKESELGMIPKDWEVNLLKTYCERISVGIATSSSKHVREKGVLFLRNQNIKENNIDLNDILFITKDFAEINRSKYLKAGDVITVRTGYPGISAVVTEDLEGSQTFTTLITTPQKELLNSHFLSNFINSRFGKMQIFSLQGGGAQQNLNSRALELMKMIKPSLEEQEAIINSLFGLENKIDLERSTRIKHVEIKSGLMQDLLSGKVEVNF